MFIVYGVQRPDGIDKIAPSSGSGNSPALFCLPRKHAETNALRAAAPESGNALKASRVGSPYNERCR